jgi:hypothetical protein
MKSNLKLSVLAMLLAATAMAAAGMRTWHFKSGATMEAEIVAFPTPETVEVKRSDGKVFTVSDVFLAEADRAYLGTERAKQWKQVSIDKVLGTESAGRYKKCMVSGQDVTGQILVAKLPAEVETVLNNRQEQEGQITNLNSRIQNDTSAAKDASAPAAKRGSRAYRNTNKAQAGLATQDEAATKASLVKLKADHAEYLKNTKATTTVLMKKTGVVYDGLPVWECQVSQKRQ